MITINIDKAKTIAHDKRRAAREAEFKPYDDAIAKQIPGNDMAAAEQARADIRQADALVQETINMATTPEQIKAALVALEAA